MPPFEMYRHSMAAYYEQVSVSGYHFDAPEFARQYDAVYATPGSWLRDLALAIQEFSRGRRVLEIAAGHGRWTRYIAEVAAQVTVTDASARMLEQARQVVAANRSLPEGRCSFSQVDAFRIDEVPGAFDCAVAVNFFQHIPTLRQRGFIDALHRKLGSGRQVLIAINRLRAETRARLYRKPGEADLFDARPTRDGRVYEIVDNILSEDRLRAIFEGRCREFRYRLGAKFYWITYRIP